MVPNPKFSIEGKPGVLLPADATSLRVSLKQIMRGFVPSEMGNLFGGFVTA
jgi:hypothetical protein